MSFRAYSECTLCEMHEEAHTVGIPMEWEPLSLVPCPGDVEGATDHIHAPAVVVVGQNPGYNEDKGGCNFVIDTFRGKPSAGKTLREAYLPGVDLFAHASVYYVNAARCGPRSTTKVGVFNKCIPYLWDDLVQVSNDHARIALLFVSAPAVKAFHKVFLSETMNQKKSLGQQGREVEIFPANKVRGVTVALFSTYHPAWINRGNFRALHRVDSHLQALLRWVRQEQPESTPLKIVSTDSPNEEVSDL